jgi:hypothetical protein
MMNKLLFPAVLAAFCGAALAKIPAPVLDDAAKLKAAEAAAKTAWTNKVAAYQLCKAQDKTVADYRKNTGKLTPLATKPAAPAAPAAAAAGTPVAPAAIPPCADPGPFAFTPPEQKPLEASGAHSPPGTASSPPSTRTPAAAMPAKKS